ncbi:MAG: helix-turn-helix domain-containing protein [Gammaproteobacteria bacterium]|nr:helix-turn-helix domain-containing protein [Gammaproteobacteria bacterium]
MAQIWSTAEIAAERRLEFLDRHVSSMFCATDVASPVQAVLDFAEFHNVRLGHIDVIRFLGHGTVTATRRLRHIRADQADSFILYLPLTACVEMDHSGRRSEIRPGSFTFVHTARPFLGVLRADAAAPQDVYASLHVRVPGPLVRERLPQLEHCCNRVFPVAPGASRLMSNLVESVLIEGESLTAAQAVEICGPLVQVICLAADEALRGLGSGVTAPDAQRGQALERVRTYILANLSNPGLNTILLARSCGMSVRYLHALFEGSGWTVASWIRELRLQKCRIALRDSRLSGRSIAEIALAWGFNDPGHFSRLYKNRFKCLPREDRRVGSGAG